MEKNLEGIDPIAAMLEVITIERKLKTDEIMIVALKNGEIDIFGVEPKNPMMKKLRDAVQEIIQSTPTTQPPIGHHKTAPAKTITTKKIKAVFRGGNGSVGFEHGKQYDLQIAWKPTADFKNPIHIIYWCDVCKTNHTKVAYESILSFLNNWDNVTNG